MADENDGSPSTTNVLHFANAFILESRIADSQNFINQQNLWLQMGRHGESQSHIHATGIMLNRRVNELFDFGERDDLIKFTAYFAASHSEIRAVQVDVLPSAKFRMETRADFEQASDAAVNVHLAGCRLGDAGKYFE